MNIETFTDMYESLMYNNSWLSGHGLSEHKFIFKYMNFDIDSRTGDIWRIEFRTCYNCNREKWADDKGHIAFRELNNKNIITQLREFLNDCEDYNRE